MKKCIAIPTHKSTKLFFDDLIKSLDGTKYHILVHENTDENNQFEIGALRSAVSQGFDEIFLLPDTCLIKDVTIFDTCFDNLEGFSVSYAENFLSFIGKYRKIVIDEIGLPDVTDKWKAVEAESNWNKRYIFEEPFYVTLFPDFKDNDNFVEKHGRKNMILDNRFMTKFKGCWCPSMIRSKYE